MNENQKKRWIQGRARWLEQNGPDMFPVGYWLYVAEREWQEAHDGKGEHRGTMQDTR